MNRSSGDIIILLLFTAAVYTLCISCQDKEPLEVFFEEDEMLISAYLEKHSEDYSTLIRILEITNLKSTLNAYGHYTFFAPDNDAFQEFFAQQGKSTAEEFDPGYLATLIRYHLLDIEIESSYFRDGVIQDTTYSGDHLVITFSTGGLETIMVNDASISERDIHVENGLIHRINGVLTPIIGSIVDRLREFEEYRIFTDALDISGLSDSLNIIRIDLNEDIFIRSRFTIFVESDEVYKQEGIKNANDLVAKYSDTGDPTDEDNGFYQFMAYHIIPGLHYLNEIDSFNYPTLAENQLINVRITENIYLNSKGGDGGVQPAESSVMVIEGQSNRQAKNGVFHEIDHLLEPLLPPPVYLVVDLTDYQGISIGKDYSEKDLEDIPGLSSEHTGIYFRNSILGDGETNLQTTSNSAGWMVEFELAPILRGRYDVYLHFASHRTNTNQVQGFWDEARFGGIQDFQHQRRDPEAGSWLRDFNTNNYIGRLLLTETATHTIKFIALGGGFGNFDYLVFQPIED
ncbi:MAG: fasciclin domain-containing protein [Bacteroidales bacterium]|nr:fasciclin domain-containing protein [Bacteroidales bacterium]